MGNSGFLGLTLTTVAFVCQFYVSDVPGAQTLAYAKVEKKLETIDGDWYGVHVQFLALQSRQTNTLES